MSNKLKTIQSVYETTEKVRHTIGKGHTHEGEIRIRTYIHDGFIEIIDDDMDKKAFVFAGKDTPEKREYWLKILRTIETAIKLTPSGKE